MNFYFIGVTTKQSAINRILPLWCKLLNVDINLIGIDLPLNASKTEYRDTVTCIKTDADALGSVVTSHKLNIFEHACDLFLDFDEMAQLTKEICVISKQNSGLIGSALPECLSSAKSLKTMLGSGYWNNNAGDVLCLGAGGVARTIALSLLCDFESINPLKTKQKFKPRKIFLVDIDDHRLELMKSLLSRFQEDVEIEYICQADSESNDQLLVNLPNGSLIVNATGLGKDRTGSPLTDAVSFPRNSIVWDLNYRGDLQFLKQAKIQEGEKQLSVYDGWHCFLHGWAQAIQLSLGQKFSPGQLRQLIKVAEPFHK